MLMVYYVVMLLPVDVMVSSVGREHLVVVVVCCV